MSNAPGTIRGNKIKACDNCRQLKLRCDALKDYSKPCSRCQRFRRPCTVTRNFRRVKRQTKAELEAELDSLRKQVESAVSPQPQDAPTIRTSNAKRSSQAPNLVPNTQGPQSPQSQSTGVQRSEAGAESTLSSVLPKENLSEFMAPIPAPVLPADPYVSSPIRLNVETTGNQIIQDLNVDAQDIDDCFALFFENHLDYTPIFERRLLPNDCHALSPFLFWTIVAVGARRYARDPTLILSLAPKVMEMAKNAIFATEKILPNIQALILLCHWQMPIDTLQKDITPMLAGGLLQLSVNIGLHVFGSAHDFSRVTLRYDQQQRHFRFKLWSICLLTCQRVNNVRGFPPIMLQDAYGQEGSLEDSAAVLPANVRFQKRLCQLHSEANLAIQQDTLSKRPGDRVTLLSSTIDMWLGKINQLESVCPSRLDHFYLLSSRLALSACYLLMPSTYIVAGILIGMYEDACRIIEVAVELDETENLAEYGPFFINAILQLAAFMVLRVGKSHIHASLDQQRGKRCYFAIISISKRHSVRSDDLAARASIILPQLYTSKSIIRRPDGTPDSLWLRCRSRLGFSICYDCYWLWRQEYGGQPGSYDRIPDESTSRYDDNAAMLDPAPYSGDALDLMGLDWSPETLLHDFQWPQIDDVFGAEWQVNNVATQPSLGKP